MGNKIVALLLLVCLGNVEGGSYPEEECFNNCHRELDEKYSVMYVNATCMFRCVKWIGKFHVITFSYFLDHILKFKF